MKIDGNLWIDINGLGAAGAERIRLLELIEETGSIKKAAAANGISYKTAWDSINTLNSIFDENLVERKSGGKGGGGTMLTPAGKDLVKTYNHYRSIHEVYLSDITSLNKIEAEITDTDGEYATALTNNGDILACIKIDSELQSGDLVNLFIKPSDIILINSSDFETSARNILKVTILSIIDQSRKSTLLLKTGKGTEFCTKITTKSTERMGLETGSEIFALFKTASVLAAGR